MQTREILNVFEYCLNFSYSQRSRPLSLLSKVETEFFALRYSKCFHSNNNVHIFIPNDNTKCYNLQEFSAKRHYLVVDSVSHARTR